jgi:hypothetical protein
LLYLFFDVLQGFILDDYCPGTPVSSTIKTDRHDTTEILLKVALNTITLTHIYDINPAIIMGNYLNDMSDACLYILK